jgi:hypothetical protein
MLLLHIHAIRWSRMRNQVTQLGCILYTHVTAKYDLVKIELDLSDKMQMLTAHKTAKIVKLMVSVTALIPEAVLLTVAKISQT